MVDAIMRYLLYFKLIYVFIVIAKKVASNPKNNVEVTQPSFHQSLDLMF